MDRATLLSLWDESWDEGIWIAPWSKAVAGITPSQAAWKPAPDRHSIWQIVAHVNFWREYTLELLAGKPKLSAEEVERRNFPEPEAASEAAWNATREQLRDLHQRMRAAIANESLPLDRPKYHLAHDAYHLGQIMYLRGMQGFGPIDV